MINNTNQNNNHTTYVVWLIKPTKVIVIQLYVEWLIIKPTKVIVIQLYVEWLISHTMVTLYDF